VDTSSVIREFAWRRSSCAVLRSTPAARRLVAREWRKLCHPIVLSLISARVTAGRMIFLSSVSGDNGCFPSSRNRGKKEIVVAGIRGSKSALGYCGVDSSRKAIGVLESTSQRGHQFSPRCLRSFDLALRRRDFTADSEMPNISAISDIEASSRYRICTTARRVGDRYRMAWSSSSSKAF
jgi:hypothetical protein